MAYKAISCLQPLCNVGPLWKGGQRMGSSRFTGNQCCYKHLLKNYPSLCVQILIPQKKLTERYFEFSSSCTSR